MQKEEASVVKTKSTGGKLHKMIQDCFTQYHNPQFHSASGRNLPSYLSRLAGAIETA